MPKLKLKSTLEFDELKDVLRIVELNRDLVINLHNLLEATKKRNEEMKSITITAQCLSNLLSKYRGKEVRDLVGKDISDEQKRSLNSIFQQKHIQLRFPIPKKTQSEDTRGL